MKRTTPTRARRQAATPRPRFKPVTTMKSGARVFETLDGMFRLVLEDCYFDIPMRPTYVVWRWLRGGWHRAAEHRSRAAADKTIRRLAAELDDE